ncbi:25063_t:CDS:2, partial [Cetraspora pellucida]
TLTFTASAQEVDVYQPEEGSTIYKPFYGKVAWDYDPFLLDSEVYVSILGYYCNSSPGTVQTCSALIQSFWNTTT